MLGGRKIGREAEAEGRNSGTVPILRDENFETECRHEVEEFGAGGIGGSTGSLRMKSNAPVSLGKRRAAA